MGDRALRPAFGQPLAHRRSPRHRRRVPAAWVGQIRAAEGRHGGRAGPAAVLSRVRGGGPADVAAPGPPPRRARVDEATHAAGCHARRSRHPGHRRRDPERERCGRESLARLRGDRLAVARRRRLYGDAARRDHRRRGDRGSRRRRPRAARPTHRGAARGRAALAGREHRHRFLCVVSPLHPGQGGELAFRRGQAPLPRRPGKPRRADPRAQPVRPRLAGPRARPARPRGARPRALSPALLRAGRRGGHRRPLRQLGFRFFPGLARRVSRLAARRIPQPRRAQRRMGERLRPLGRHPADDHGRGAAARKGSLAPWSDFKEWMDEAFARAVRAGTDAVHAADPGALAGIEGAQIPGWGGYDYTPAAASGRRDGDLRGGGEYRPGARARARPRAAHQRRLRRGRRALGARRLARGVAGRRAASSCGTTSTRCPTRPEWRGVLDACRVLRAGRGRAADRGDPASRSGGGALLARELPHPMAARPPRRGRRLDQARRVAWNSPRRGRCAPPSIARRASSRIAP